MKNKGMVMNKIEISAIVIAVAFLCTIMSIAIYADGRSKKMMLRQKGIDATYWEALGTTQAYICGLDQK